MSKVRRQESADERPVDLPDLPHGWAWATPTDIAADEPYSLAIGPFGSSLKTSDYRDAGTPLVFVRNIRSGEFGAKSTHYVSAEKATELKAHKVSPGDVLVTKMGDPPGDATVYPAGQPDAIITADCIKVRPNPAVCESRFLAYGINSQVVRKQVSGITQGVAQQKVSLGRFSTIWIPLPPKTEQQRIVDRIDELLSDLDAGVAALERAHANLNRYRAAVLKAAVTGDLTADWRAAHPNVGPATKLLDRILAERRRKWEADTRAKFAANGKSPQKNWQAKYAEPAGPVQDGLPDLPSGWCWVRLDQMISYLRNGYFESPVPLESGVRILRINAVRPMSVDLNEYRYLPPSDDLADYFVEDNDLLFTRYNGSLDLLGVAGMVRGCKEPTVHPDKLIRVKSVLPAPLPSYLEIACNVGVSRRHMLGRARTTAGQKGVSGGDVRDIPMPLPPLAEQQVIADRVEEALSLISATGDYIDASLKRAGRLRQSILKEAFAGRLVPQDPHDEPASVLLDRLRTGNGQRIEHPDAGSGAVASTATRRSKRR